MLTQKEIERNLNAVENAIAQQTLEGLTVSEDVIENLKKSARGELSLRDCFKLEMMKYAKIRRK